MTRERFAEMVERAVNELPEAFLGRLGNVAFVVEDEPSADDLEALGLNPNRDTLFGLYDGVPLPERRGEVPATAPDRIVIYYRPLVRAFRTPWAIRREIKTTIVHEVAHYFGLDEDEVADEGYQ